MRLTRGSSPILVSIGLCAAAGIGACSDRPLPIGATTPGPLQLRPFPGETTGSVRAEAALRPAFRWSAVGGASAYEIDVDDSCDAAATCLFPSPEVHERVASTSFRPTQALPVAEVAPVGRRYYWRVRACSTSTCSQWSPTRYLDVGRQRQDFNGDGFGDLVVSGQGDIRVYFGASVLDATADWSVSVAVAGGEEEAPGDVVWAGDMNGDGFSDLAAVICTAGRACTVRMISGGTAPSPEWTRQISAGDGVAQPSLRVAGDLDGDELADVAAVWPGKDLNTRSTLLIFGGATGNTPRTQQLPVAAVYDVIGGCDLNGDGVDDLVGTGADQVLLAAGGPSAGAAGFSFKPFGTAPGYVALACAGDVDGSGRAAAVLGRATHDAQDPAPLLRILQPDGLCNGREMSNPVGGFVSRPTVAGRADLNGDGIHDLVVGDPGASRALFAMGGSCPPGAFSTLAHRADGLARSNTGSAVASPGDMNGDGFDEAAVANPLTGIDSAVGGEVYILRGGAVGPTSLDVTVVGDGRFGHSID